MQADMMLFVHPTPMDSNENGNCFELEGPGITPKPPPSLVSAQFPCNEQAMPLGDCVAVTAPDSDVVVRRLGTAQAKNFIDKHQNLVVYSYGIQGTNRRELMVGTNHSQGYAQRFMATAMEHVQASSIDGIFMMQAYIMGSEDAVVDALEPNNMEAMVVETSREGPRLRDVSRRSVRSAADVAQQFQMIIETYTAHFKDVLGPVTNFARGMTPYNGDTIVISLLRYEEDIEVEQQMEQNSMTFVALGDANRPPLCGVDRKQLTSFESTQKALVAVVSIVNAIRASRLRVPFSKSKLTLLQRRCYNKERGYRYSSINAPTRTLLVTHIIDHPSAFEESFHILSVLRRLIGSMGMVGVGAITRDLAADKWRLEQDTSELRDELAIAKAVFDYRPCIVDQAKPVQNVAEEEQKRVVAIKKKREEARERMLAEVRAAAEDEARRYIEAHESKCSVRIDELETTVAEEQKRLQQLKLERAKKLKEQERHLEKVRKKKDEEEAQAQRVKEELKVLEKELQDRRLRLAQRRKELDDAATNQRHNLEALLKEREAKKRQYQESIAQRRVQRQEWLAEIEKANTHLKSLIRQVEDERASYGTQYTEVTETTKVIRDDIDNVNQFLKRVLALEKEETPDTADSIRRQLEEYFSQERLQYKERIASLSTKKEELEAELQACKVKQNELVVARKREREADALKKERNLHTLVDQVVIFLQHGTVATKISSRKHVRRRFFFISTDLKRLQGCECDERGEPSNRRRPTVTLFLKDITRVVLGTYGASMSAFSGEATLARARAAAFRPNGTNAADPTATITPAVLGKYNYRCFALHLRGGKRLELVTESDSDFEAWVVGLKRVLRISTPMERQRDKAARGGAEDPPPEGRRIEMQWGGPADLRGMPGVGELTPEEVSFCSYNHIAAKVYLSAKEEMAKRGQTSTVTLYDTRLISSLDMFRAQALYERFLELKVITR